MNSLAFHQSVLSVKVQTVTRELPHRDQDTVLRLYVHYFVPADLIYDQITKVRGKVYKANDKLKQQKKEEFTYIRIWLGLLYVVCEGFDEELGKILKSRPADFWKFLPWHYQIVDSISDLKTDLRMFRNGQFHFQKSHEKQSRIFASKLERLVCAEQLHLGIRRFFSEYRLVCEIYYLQNGRVSEGSFGQKSR